MNSVPNNKKGSKITAASLCLFISIVTLSVGIMIGKFGISDKIYFADEIRAHDNEFAFINPLLECSNNSVPEKNITALQTMAKEYIEAEKKNGDISYVSLYFRDLKNGPWFGIDEQAPFSPASLLKLPFMIALYKQDEVDNSLFGKKITYAGEHFDMPQYFKPEKMLASGTPYTVRQLMEHMILYSDNDAAYVLLKHYPNQDNTKEIYNDLGIPEPLQEDYKISVKEYAAFFRILYNATYLERSESENALKLLSETSFKDGIRAGVPSNIAVASKFGERFNENSLEKQLHDCGIVYYPSHPYLLCIMTRGNDFQTMAGVIGNLSKMTYRMVSKE